MHAASPRKSNGISEFFALDGIRRSVCRNLFPCDLFLVTGVEPDYPIRAHLQNRLTDAIDTKACLKGYKFKHIGWGL